MLQLVDKEDCSSTKNCGMRITDRRKLDTKKKERTTGKEIIVKRKGHKYRYLIYWDKIKNVPKNKCLGRIDD